MNAEQREIEDFVSTDEYLRLSDPLTLGATEDAGDYLRNRLWKAYVAGMRAGRKIERDAILASLRRLFEGNSS